MQSAKNKEKWNFAYEILCNLRALIIISTSSHIIMIIFIFIFIIVMITDYFTTTLDNKMQIRIRVSNG